MGRHAMGTPLPPCFCKIVLTKDLWEQGTQNPLPIGLRDKIVLTKDLGGAAKGQTGVGKLGWVVDR
jgi:hypothetical protein